MKKIWLGGSGIQLLLWGGVGVSAVERTKQVVFVFELLGRKRGKVLGVVLAPSDHKGGSARKHKLARSGNIFPLSKVRANAHAAIPRSGFGQHRLTARSGAPSKQRFVTK